MRPLPPPSLTQADLFTKTKVAVEEPAAAVELLEDKPMFDEEKKAELVILGIWGVSISAFILINDISGPWPSFMKTIPERVFFYSHMIGGMLFGGGIILTTCIERLVAKSQNPPVLQFWFDKVPALDGLIVVPALTISMLSGTGLSIVRYGGLNVAPPHVGAIFWTLIAFMSWWAATDLTTQGAYGAAWVLQMRPRKHGENCKNLFLTLSTEITLAGSRPGSIPQTMMISKNTRVHTNVARLLSPHRNRQERRGAHVPTV